jgi:Holliday junction resolvase
MGPEAKLYQKLRKNITDISWIRIENLSRLGTPDLLAYNSSGHFFTVELKVTKGKKLRFSPHQICFHVQHPNNTFILAEALGPRSSKLSQYFLVPGSRIRELAACGLTPELEACRLTLEACRLKFQEV